MEALSYCQLMERNIALEAEVAELRGREQAPVYQACKEAGVWVDIDAKDVDLLRFNGEQIRKVYTAPPAPVVVPDEIESTSGSDYDDYYCDGWNACRAAMLKK